MESGRIKVGAEYVGGGCRFAVWAPFMKEVSLRILPSEKPIPMEHDNCGYWRIFVEGATPGTHYLFCLDNDRERPDPASSFQPEGVHGPSEIVDHSFNWADGDWKGIPLSEMVIYELHVGTFTPEGTFDGAIKMIPYLKELGVNAIEIMPVAQFPGERNWGYDGAYPFAVQNSYGGPSGLKRLVNECHVSGMSVVLDVVYNHLGPEGNYLPDYGPYLSEKCTTVWGNSLNFDGPYSDNVRNYFIENALHWFEKYHIDALRLDAGDNIQDRSAKHFLEELSEIVDELSFAKNRKLYLIAETDLNDPRFIKPREKGGIGLHAQWNDDFHHCLHVLLTGEKRGYYMDFGNVEQLGKDFREGFVYSGQYSNFRKRRHGRSSKEREAYQFIVFSQSHDQIGNRGGAERLSKLVSYEKLKLAAGAVILSPHVPLLFMGEEYGETAPFQYFTSHSDKDLIKAVSEGRKKEFSHFKWEGDYADPQDEKTFMSSKLNLDLHKEGKHKVLFDFYKELMKLRKGLPALRNLNKDNMDVICYEDKKAMLVIRWFEEEEVFTIYNFSDIVLKMELPIPEGNWEKLIESSSRKWGGDGGTAADSIKSDNQTLEFNINPCSFVLYRSFDRRE